MKLLFLSMVSAGILLGIFINTKCFFIFWLGIFLYLNLTFKKK